MKRDIAAASIGFGAGAICILAIPNGDGLLLGLFVGVVITLILFKVLGVRHG